MNPQEEQPQGLISIERVVAFIVGPILTVGFGWLTSWLAQNVPGAPVIPAEAAAYVGGAVSLAVAGLIYKWLHGRQVTLPVEQIIKYVSPAGVGTLDRPPPFGVIPSAEHDPAPSGQVADAGAATGQ